MPIKSLQNIIYTVSEYTFVDSLTPNAFTYEGARALFQWYEQLEDETGEQIEFDPVAIRCDWSEFASFEEFCAEYGNDYETLEELQERTQLINFKHGLLIRMEASL